MKLSHRGPLENVYANENNIITAQPHDDFTVSFLHTHLSNYPISYGHTAYGGVNDSMFFGRVFFWGEWIDEFNPRNLPAPIFYLTEWAMKEGIKLIHSDARLLSLHRITLNGQTPNQFPSIHYDDVDDATKWTFIYYVTPGDDTNGGTMIYNNAIEEQPFYHCTYRQGKWLIFPSCYTHQALPSIESWRMSVGIVLKIDTPQNHQL